MVNHGSIILKDKYVEVTFLEAPIKKVVLSTINPDVKIIWTIVYYSSSLIEKSILEINKLDVNNFNLNGIEAYYRFTDCN